MGVPPLGLQNAIANTVHHEQASMYGCCRTVLTQTLQTAGHPLGTKQLSNKPCLRAWWPCEQESPYRRCRTVFTQAWQAAAVKITLAMVQSCTYCPVH